MSTIGARFLSPQFIIYKTQNAIEEPQNKSEHPTNEYLPLTDDEDNENLSVEKCHQKVYKELQNKFFRSKLNNNNLKKFRQWGEALIVNAAEP